MGELIMNLKGSKTEKNLWEAFAGESQARNKYTYYASKAKKEGYEQIASLFLETADNEKEHAKIWFKLAHGIGSTLENLNDAAYGENFECTLLQVLKQMLLCKQLGNFVMFFTLAEQKLGQCLVKRL